MKSSDASDRVDEIISRLLDRLGGDHSRRHIDEPIDRAFGCFALPEEAILSSCDFVTVAGRLVAHIYAHGLQLPLLLTPAQAQAEAIMLLDRYYRTAEDHAFESSLLDVLNPNQDGLELVLSTLVDIIKQCERGEFTKFVYLEILVPLNWEQRCALVQRLLTCYADFLPQNVLSCRSAQLADEIPTLFATLLDVRSGLLPRYAS